MKPFYYLSLMTTLLNFEVAHSQMMPAPLSLKASEQVTFRGNAGDTVTCDGVIYNNQALGIVVTEIAKDCDCGPEGLKRIYVDGLLAGTCKGNVNSKQQNKYLDAYINMDRLQDFTDDEILKLFGRVGSCIYTNKEMKSETGKDASSAKLSSLFNSFLLENEIMLKKPKDSKEVQVKTLREFAKNGFCGTYDKSLVAFNTDNSNKILGRLDVGFDFIKSSGATGPDMVKMFYPVAKLRATFKDLTIEDFKHYEPSELRKAGFTLAEFKVADYGLNDLISAGFDTIKELKPIYKIQDFKDVGYEARDLKNLNYTAKEIKEAGFSLNNLAYAGFDTKKDLKSLYTIKEFKDSDYEARDLRNLDYTAKEIKEAGFSLNNLVYAGFDTKKDLKPIYTIKEFKDNKYEARDLRNLDYTAKEIKEAGFSLNTLVYAGFDTKKDLKPLYTIKEFKDNKYEARDLRNLDYTAKEIKEAGFSLNNLVYAGFDTKKDLKPLYTIKEFKDNKYDTRDLKNVGFTAKEMRNGGITFDEIQYAGFSTQELKDAGYIN